MQTRIQSFLTEHRISQASLAEVLALDQASISRRVSGATQWRLPEVLALLAYFSKLLGRPVSLEEAFGPTSAADDVVAPVAPESMSSEAL